MNSSHLLTLLLFAIPLTGCLTTSNENESCEHFDRQEQVDYLNQNATKEGVIVTESGLQYRILEEAEGPKPTTSDTVEVEYTGFFIDGTVFDSTENLTQPVRFRVDGLIDGFEEGLQLMNKGAKHEFVIPSNLGYGETPSGPICPGATLVFEVELVDIL